MCGRVNCDDEYIGESSRTLGERFKEHLKAPPFIYDPYKSAGHPAATDNLSRIEREDQDLTLTIIE